MKYIAISFLFLFFLLFVSSCCVDETAQNRSPLISVIKLLDAEQTVDIETAKKYIDVDQVYTKLGSKTPQEDWEKFIRFQYNLGQDNKFTNVFPYRNYNIEETINGNNASVCFKDESESAAIKAITYGLEIRENKWIVVSITYEKD